MDQVTLMKSDSQISITVYPFDSRYDLRSWQQGREKFKKRMSNKDFTEKEKELYFKKRSGIVKNQWAKLSENEKEMRTDPGLQIMNSKFVCEHCMVETNSGNYHRWHGTNCKKASKC